jgi:choline dehydrogenase-like flavoprotein
VPTNLTTIMLAERCADRVREALATPAVQSAG